VKDTYDVENEAFELLSVSAFLRLDVEKAKALGGLYSNLMSTKEGEPEEEEPEEEPSEYAELRAINRILRIIEKKGELSPEEIKLRDAMLEYKDYLGLEDPEEEAA
jgi:hypothetical protein